MVDVSVEMMPLLFSRSVRVTALTLKEPELALLRAPSGKWNFSSLGGGRLRRRQRPQRQEN